MNQISILSIVINKVNQFKKESNSRNHFSSLPKKVTQYNSFGEFHHLVPNLLHSKDSTPGLRYFGMASGYSQSKRSIIKDYEINPIMN